MTPRRLQNLRRDLPPAIDAQIDPATNGEAPNGAPDYFPPPPRRPKIVGLIGWICAGVGYASFVLKGAPLPSHFMDMRWLNPAWQPMPLSRGQFSVTVSFLFAEMALGLLAIAAGLGTLKMRHWGRRFVVYYAMLALVLTLLKAAWQVAMFDVMLDHWQASTTQPFDRTVVGNGAFFRMLVMTAAQVMWCVILASIMTRPYVREAFDRANGIHADDDGWRSA